MENVTQKTELTLIDLVRKDTMAEFTHFRNGVLFYNIEVLSGDLEGDVYQLRLDPEDFINTDLNRSEKSSIFMRWIKTELKEKRINRVN